MYAVNKLVSNVVLPPGYMVTCTGHIGIHEGADGRTDVRTYVRTLYVRTLMTPWL